jgi:hypothetical protein
LVHDEETELLALCSHSDHFVNVFVPKAVTDDEETHSSCHEGCAKQSVVGGVSPEQFEATQKPR